jgi:hypothetical protein
MSIPGFTAEASFSLRSQAHIGVLKPTPAGNSRIVPALPIGGYGQLECVKAICKFSPKDCSSAYRLCGGASGVSAGTSGPDPWCIVACGGDPNCMDAFC